MDASNSLIRLTFDILTGIFDVINRIKVSIYTFWLEVLDAAEARMSAQNGSRNMDSDRRLHPPRRNTEYVPDHAAVHVPVIEMRRKYQEKRRRRYRTPTPPPPEFHRSYHTRNTRATHHGSNRGRSPRRHLPEPPPFMGVQDPDPLEYSPNRRHNERRRPYHPRHRNAREPSLGLVLSIAVVGIVFLASRIWRAARGTERRPRPRPRPRQRQTFVFPEARGSDYLPDPLARWPRDEVVDYVSLSESSDDEDIEPVMSGALTIPIVQHSLNQRGALPVFETVDLQDPAPSLARGQGSTGPDMDCVVCGEEYNSNHFLLEITPACEHQVNTCRECIGQWIRSSLQNHAWDNMQCPECPEPLGYEDIMRIAPLDIADIITSQSARTVLCQIPDFHWCTSPTCTSGQIHSSSNPIMTCHACNQRTCITHSIPFHEGETCAEYSYRQRPRHKMKEERASEKLMGRIAKRCPGDCGAKIQKNNGCDHMTCRHCRYEFCWVCLADYHEIRRIGNSAHGRNCSHWRENVPIRY